MENNCVDEGIDKFSGNVRLTKVIGDESFVTIGTDKSEPPYVGSNNRVILVKK